MRLSRRDALATVLVGAGALIAVLWWAGIDVPGVGGVRGVAIVVLAAGVAASASAFVPTFGDLLHGSRIYLAITSIIGVAALVAGLLAAVRRSDPMLVTLVGATVALWLISTIRHGTATGHAQQGGITGSEDTIG